jgi:hypothetical protein
LASRVVRRISTSVIKPETPRQSTGPLNRRVTDVGAPGAVAWEAMRQHKAPVLADRWPRLDLCVVLGPDVKRYVVRRGRAEEWYYEVWVNDVRILGVVAHQGALHCADACRREIEQLLADGWELQL